MDVRCTPANRSRGRQRRRWTDDIIEWTGLTITEAARSTEDRDRRRGILCAANPSSVQEEGIERRRTTFNRSFTVLKVGAFDVHNKTHRRLGRNEAATALHRQERSLSVGVDVLAHLYTIPCTSVKVAVFNNTCDKNILHDDIDADIKFCRHLFQKRRRLRNYRQRQN